MKCEKCGNTVKSIFRTTKIGSDKAGWSCINCIKKNGNTPKPDSDLILLINDLVEVNENNWLEL